MEKTLSIAVPSYNVERYLADSLASYCAGEIDDRLEVLIVNDGSTDSTPAIAREFVRLCPSIFKLVNKENGGHGSAINAGIREASGAYFRIIDGDDRICTINIPQLLDALDAATDDLVIDVKRDIVMDTGESRLLHLPDDIAREQTTPFESVCMRADIEKFFMIHTTNVRTAFLREHDVKLLEHTFYVDYEFIVKIASHAQTIRFLDLEACNYFTGNAEQSVAPANYVRRWADHTRVTEELLAYAQTADLDPVRKQFVDERVRLIVNTHYNIALIFDDDRARGLERGRAFHAFLKERYPIVAAATEKRYRQALVLHYLGFDAGRLDRLMGRGS